jgi:hypothetical protein
MLSLGQNVPSGSKIGPPQMGQKITKAVTKRVHPAEAQYRKALLIRTQLLRESIGLSQESMAKILGIPLDRYRKYETRSPLPLYLIEPFAAATGYSVQFVVTGKAAPSESAPAEREAERRDRQ